MPQQNPHVGGVPYRTKDNYERRLFINSGTGFYEVANSSGTLSDYGIDSGKIARIVNDYGPPTPVLKPVEIVISNGPSKLHSDGKASFKISLRLIFPDKIQYSEFIYLSGNQFKYYDEKGAIYSCILADSVSVERVEGGRRYDVTLELIGVKKSTEIAENEVPFTDLSNSSAGITFQVISSSGHHAREMELRFYTSLGDLFYVLNRKVPILSTPIIQAYHLYYDMKESNIPSYFDIQHVHGTTLIVLVPKFDIYLGEVEYDDNGSGLDLLISSGSGDHWAKASVEDLVRVNILNRLDSNSNLVYTFRPNEYTTRAELGSIINRLRKYLDKVIPL